MKKYLRKTFRGFISGELVTVVVLLALGSMIAWSIVWPTNQNTHQSWVSIGESQRYQIDLDDDGKRGTLNVFGPDKKLSRQSPVAIEKIDETEFLVSTEGKKLKFLLTIEGGMHILTCSDCFNLKPPLALIWQIIPR